MNHCTALLDTKQRDIDTPTWYQETNTCHAVAKISGVLSFINPLAPGSCGCNLELVIFKLTSMRGILSISRERALRGITQDITDD